MSEMLSGNLEQLVRRHPAGAVLFREGDRGEKMYVIRAGKVNIWKRISENDLTLAVLGPGEFFGEMALLEGLPRSAGATVVEDAMLIEVEAAAFEMLVRKNSEIAVRLMRRLSSRLREADRQIQALMSRSGAARALSLIRTLAEAPDKKGRRFLPEELTPEVVTARVGLTGDEARRVQHLPRPQEALRVFRGLSEDLLPKLLGGLRAGRRARPAGGALDQVPEVQE